MRRFLKWIKCLFKKDKKPTEKTAVIVDEKAFFGDPPADIDNPEWEPLLVDPNGIIVTWQEKYGTEKTMICIGVWFSKKRDEYMLTWKDERKVYIPKSNLNSIEYKKQNSISKETSP